MAFPLTIHLGYGQEKIETSSQKQKLGTRAVTLMEEFSITQKIVVQLLLLLVS